MQATPVVSHHGDSPAGADCAPGTLPPELAIVVSSLDDAAGRSALLARIAAALPGVAWQLIVVADGPAADAAMLAQKETDPRLRIVGKADPRALTSARVEGMRATAAPFVAVIGADLRAAPALLGTMLRLAREGAADLVVASRYLARTATFGDAPDDHRARAGRIATRLAGAVGGPPLSDPMSGSFLIRRGFVEGYLRDLAGGGAELLLDILLASRRRPPRVIELPSPAVAWDFVMLLADRMIGGAVPMAFVVRATIAALGVAAHRLTRLLAAIVHAARPRPQPRRQLR